VTYYAVLRSELRRRPELKECLTRCRHCRIFFLCDPRNAGRDDLGCPFGCREAHRRRQSTQRSAAYYRTESGRIKKRIQNEKRQNGCRVGPVAAAAELCPAVMVAYLQMLIGLIEGRRVSRGEILELVARVLRQRSMARRRRIDHIVAWLNEQPP